MAFGLLVVALMLGVYFAALRHSPPFSLKFVSAALADRRMRRSEPRDSF